jgi:hypothetical protein
MNLWFLSIAESVLTMNHSSNTQWQRHIQKRLRWSRGSVLAFGTQVRGLKPGRTRRIFKGEKKNPQHAFLRRGSKAGCPMSRFTACKRTQKWRGSRHFGEKFLGHFSPIVPPSDAGFPSVASDVGDLLWWKLERSKSLVLLQGGGLTCRWQRHTVKPSCWECSTTVEQAEIQLRVVVQIAETFRMPANLAAINWTEC